MRTFIADLRFGARALRNSPGFALLAILSIGVGVGANAAMFSLADGLLLRPLGIPRAGELLSVVGTGRDTGFSTPGVSYPDFVDLRERSRSFERLVAFNHALIAFDARPDRPALRTLGALVSGELLEAMGVTPAIGRFFTRDEDRVPGRDAVMVLDHRAWVDRFGADPGIIGRQVRLGKAQFTVIGVADASFRGLGTDVWPTFYVPMAMSDSLFDPLLTRRDRRPLEVRGHLRPGVSIAQARDEVAAIGAQLAAEHPDVNRGLGLGVQTEFERRFNGPDASLIVMLFLLAIAVLLVACANVANMLTSRAPVRAREIALRLALGAGRARVVRQLLAESLLLAGGGAIAGLTIAYGSILLFRLIEFPTEVPLKLYFVLDTRVMTTALLVAVATAVFASLIPAWQATRVDLVFSIKGAPQTRVSRQWGRQMLVCAQVALSLVVVTIAAGFYSGFKGMMLTGPGYRTDRLLLMQFDGRLATYDDEESTRFYRQLRERAAELPGVRSVAMTSSVAMKTDTTEFMRVAPEGARLPNDATDISIRSSRVDEGYFATAGIPIVAGRGFAETDDADASRVAIVNQTFAERYWPGRPALGQRVRVWQPGESGPGEWHEVVGLARNAIYDWVGEEPQAFVYLSAIQSPAVQQALMVEADRPETLVAPLHALVRSIDPNMPPFSVRTMADLYQSRGVTVPMVIVSIIAGLGAMGFALALSGLYGLIAYAVNRRFHEFGIRMAVGATPQNLLGLVLRRAATLTAVGVGLGTIMAIAAAGSLQSGLSGTGRWFHGTLYAAVAATLLGVALLAAYVPARRAAKVDPLVALRSE